MHTLQIKGHRQIGAIVDDQGNGVQRRDRLDLLRQRQQFAG
jgi:hypothetical protein